MEANIVPDNKPSKDDAKGARLVTKHHGSKSDAIKRSLKYHMAGLRGGRSGLAFKALEKLSHLVDSPDDATALAAVDKVIKLLPYTITREENPGILGMQGHGAPMNIQINFGEQLSKRLQGTHLQGLMSNLVPSSAQLISEAAEALSSLTPPPAPGVDP